MNEALLAPMIRAVLAAVQKDAAAFNERLALLLKNHRRWYSKKDNVNDPMGFICWSGLAAVVMAREQGLSVEVTDDYLPAEILELYRSAAT